MEEAYVSYKTPLICTIYKKHMIILDFICAICKNSNRKIKQGREEKWH